MKKFFITAFAVLLGPAVFAGAKINIELDGRSTKNGCSDIAIISGDMKSVALPEKDGNVYNYAVVGNSKLTSEWQTYSFSFIPQKAFLALGMGATYPKNMSVEYDNIKIEGGNLYNPSFEIINEDKEIDGWRYYSPDCQRSGDAADGKVYICGAYGAAVRQSIRMTPGKKVTITFKARIGKPLQRAEGRWYSSGKRKVK